MHGTLNFKKFRDSLEEKLYTNETELALLYLNSMLPKTDNKFPPVHFLHQVYAVINDKTKVDREANDLRAAGKAIIYRFPRDKERIMDMIVLYSIIRPHIVQQTRSRIVKKYVEEVLPSIKNSSVDSAYLMNKFSLSRSDISELVREDLLVMRDVGSYWLSFPRCGQFVKAYNCGRKEILKIIKKSKFSEVLQMELEKKKLSKKASLGMSLHILDVIGSEAVQCKPTVSGMMLRYGP